MRVITMIVIVSILLVISIIDFKIKIIPNQLNVLLFISGIWSGFVFQEVTFLSRFLGVFSVSIPMFILAILCSGGLGGGNGERLCADRASHPQLPAGAGRPGVRGGVLQSL